MGHVDKDIDYKNSELDPFLRQRFFFFLTLLFSVNNKHIIVDFVCIFLAQAMKQNKRLLFCYPEGLCNKLCFLQACGASVCSLNSQCVFDHLREIVKTPCFRDAK